MTKAGAIEYIDGLKQMLDRSIMEDEKHFSNSTSPPSETHQAVYVLRKTWRNSLDIILDELNNE